MRKLILFTLITAVCWFAVDSANADELRVPQNAVAGQPISIGLSGNGNGTLFLIGQGQIIKREVKLGNDLQIKGEELRNAGRWIAILRSGGTSQSQAFWVQPGSPENLNFLARPSRVPVNQQGAISGTVFLFDKFNNWVLQPTPVNFSLSVKGSGVTRAVTSRNGVAWIETSSAARERAAQFVASVRSASVRRVIQQVASQPCNLRMHVSQRTRDRIIVETDPVRDCTGNAVPDGTIVTFTQNDKTGRSTVDARIKKGIARAELPASDNAMVSVAAGYTLGNELRAGGR